jgi:nucleoid DNA-binding protein
MPETKVKAATKTAMYQALSAKTGRTRREVGDFFDALTDFIKDQLGKKGPGVVTFPGLLKIKRVRKPATKARQGRNPKTGEPMTIAAKPARTVAKALCLKNLKEMVKGV